MIYCKCMNSDCTNTHYDLVRKAIDDILSDEFTMEWLSKPMFGRPKKTEDDKS